ncbi:ataxin-1-like isoform X2 [Ptychodera flava]
MLSSTPPSDESQRKSDKDVTSWKHSEGSPRYHSSQSTDCRPVTSTHPDRIREFPLLSDKQSNSRNTPVRELTREEHENTSGVSHGITIAHQTMTDDNKYSTVSTVATTADSLTWLAADAASSQSEHRALVGMQSGTLTQQTASGTLFRPPLTEFNASQRLFTTGQFSTVYSTSSLGQVPFPPLQYSSHIPPVTLHSSTLPTYSPYIGAPYPAAYVQPGFPHPAALASGQYPQIESYSAMLASMGSHVQQSHGQGQVQRSTFVPAHLAHISSHYLTPVGSPLSLENPDKATPPGAVTYAAVQAMPHGQHIMANQTASISPLRQSPTPSGHSLRTEIKRERSDSRQALSDETQPSIHSKSEGSVYAAVNRSPRQSPQTINPSRSARGRERDVSASPKPTSTPHLEERGLRPNRPPNININPTKYEIQNQGHPRPPDVRSGSPQGTPSGPHTPSWSSSVNPMPPPLQPTQQTPPHTPHAIQPTQTPPHTPHTPNTPMNSTPNTQYQLSPPAFSSQPPHPHFPPHFMKGSIIQLANGELKKVEDLRTEDFVQSAAVSEDLKIDSSTVVRIDEDHQAGLAILGFSVGEHRIQVTVESTVEHPFFVFGQGWSSVRPDRTLQRYGLSCHQLSVGDVCISLTLKDKNGRLHQKEIKSEIDCETAEDVEEPEFKRPKLERPFLPHDSSASKIGQHRGGGDLSSQQTIGLCTRRVIQENEKQPEYELQRSSVRENANGNHEAGKETSLQTQKPSRLRKRRWSDPIKLCEKEKETDHLPVPLPLESLAKLSQRPIVHGISGK